MTDTEALRAERAELVAKDAAAEGWGAAVAARAERIAEIDRQLATGQAARPSPFTFAPPSYPGGRILMMLGQHQAGAVFQPVGDPPDRLPWVWRFWLGSQGTACPEGRAKTEQAAKNALLAQGMEWLRLAGVAG